MVPDAVAPCPWTFEDFCLWVSVLVDDCWQRIGPLCRRPGPAPRCSDPELTTMALVGEGKGWHEETVLLSEWAAHRDLFPRQPERLRFNRRRRQLQGAINQLRRLVLAACDFAADRLCVLDRLPVPVVRFHLVPAANRAEWQAHGASFGKVPSKKATIFGDKLSLLVTANGLIRDFALAPANVPELVAGTELLEEHVDLEVLGDKAFISAAGQARLAGENGRSLRTLPRRNQREQPTATAARALNALRQVVETVNSQLAEPFGVEVNHAQSFWGLCARLATKPTAHTLCLHLNRLPAKPEVLHIEALAFPRPN